MAIITDTDFVWSSLVTLGADEVWQARGDAVFVTTTPSPAAKDGIELRKGEAIRFPAGTQLRYRTEGPDPVEIVREVI